MPEPTFRPLAAVRLLLILAVVAPRGAAAAPVCDSATALTLLGVDTASRRVLLAVPGTSAQDPGWMADLDVSAGTAALHRQNADAPRMGGSVGPGEVLTATPCGAECARLERWTGGGWEPVGEPLPLAGTMSLAAGRDAAGTPWTVLYRTTGGGGRADAWAYRLAGRDWAAEGRLGVVSLGTPAVRPAPGRQDAIVSGSALFAAGAPPVTWARGLPRVPPGKQGQLVPLAGSAAAYVASDGAVYASGDAGATWKQLLWTPWESGRVQVRQRGSDYSVDLPTGAVDSSLHLLWFGVGAGGVESLVASATPAADLLAGSRVIFEAPAAILTDREESLPATEVVRFDDGSWLLLSGCVATRGGAGLAYRLRDAAGLSAPRLAPLRPVVAGATPSAP